jgi:hypothetical protein
LSVSHGTMRHETSGSLVRRRFTAVKFRQLAALRASVDQLAWSEALAAEEAEVRERWRRLREAYHG